MATTSKTNKLEKTKPAKSQSKTKSIPLIIEPHPAEYNGFPFITLIQYRKQTLLTIVDNVNDDTMHVFLLDLCGPSNVDEEVVVSTAAEWYYTNLSKFPVSIEFSQRGLTSYTSKLYRALNVEYISRVIGPVPMYPMATTKSVKRRRRKPLSAEVEIHRSKSILTFDQLTQQG